MVILAWVWRIGWSQGHEGTKQLAEEESETPTRYSADTGVLIAAVASLGAVVLGLIRSSNSRDPLSIVLIILSVLAVVLS